MSAPDADVPRTPAARVDAGAPPALDLASTHEMANIEAFVASSAPVFSSRAESSRDFALSELWDAFTEPSAFGAEVPLRLQDGQPCVSQYYVPFLSGMQLFVRGDGEDGEDGEDDDVVVVVGNEPRGEDEEDGEEEEKDEEEEERRRRRRRKLLTSKFARIESGLTSKAKNQQHADSLRSNAANVGHEGYSYAQKKAGLESRATVAKSLKDARGAANAKRKNEAIREGQNAVGLAMAAAKEKKRGVLSNMEDFKKMKQKEREEKSQRVEERVGAMRSKLEGRAKEVLRQRKIKENVIETLHKKRVVGKWAKAADKAMAEEKEAKRKEEELKKEQEEKRKEKANAVQKFKNEKVKKEVKKKVKEKEPEEGGDPQVEPGGGCCS